MVRQAQRLLHHHRLLQHVRRFAQFSACLLPPPQLHQPARAHARRYLHYIIDPAWEFAISSAGSYEDVIGIQMQRNMTKFDDLPGPADDAEMEMLLKHTEHLFKMV